MAYDALQSKFLLIASLPLKSWRRCVEGLHLLAALARLSGVSFGVLASLLIQAVVDKFPESILPFRSRWIVEKVLGQ